jgi:hypothetical protein
VIEIGFGTEPLDLGELQRTGAVGEKRETMSRVPQLNQQRLRPDLEPYVLVSLLAEGVSEALGHLRQRCGISLPVKRL